MAKRNSRKPTPKSRRVSKEKPAAGARGKYLGHYGWMPDVPDQRDLVFATARVTSLPPSVDLRAGLSPRVRSGPTRIVYRQRDRGRHPIRPDPAERTKPFAPSRLFIYYNERVMEHTVGQDAGAQIRDGMKSVNHIGACPRPTGHTLSRILLASPRSEPSRMPRWGKRCPINVWCRPSTK